MLLFSHFVIALLTGLILLSIAVGFSDYQYRRIPNKFLLIGIIYFSIVFIAMAFNLPLANVGRGLMMSVFGFFLGAMFLFPPYIAKQVAAGDVKLMMVFGLFLGPKGCILTILISGIVAGIWALILAWRINGLPHLWYNLKFMARSVYLSGFKDMGWDLQSEGAIKMPYGVALSVGASIIAIEQIMIHYQKLQLL